MAESVPLVRICKVVSIKDPQGMNRIKVRMTPEDNHKEFLEDLPYAFPLLPKYIFVVPKVGESVLIITENATDGDTTRYYIGPIIPQMNKMSGNMHNMEATSYLDRTYFPPEKSPYLNPEAEGVYPNDNDVSIVGKENTDIQLKDNSLLLRCGIRMDDSTGSEEVKFNDVDPAYIKLRYNINSEGGSCRSSVNVVGDKINLIGNKSADKFNTNDRKEMFTDEELEKFLEKSHELPYGDMLVDFLKKLRDAFLTHTHPYNMMPPSMGNEQLQVAKYDLDKILSDSIRIN